ncbi:MAG: asparagine synthase (glutamine-hydrolyzing) [Flavobacteriales bacterium]|nr:asparagine synthase (glutamine-hydrolyzing) [Flavobacteriales bacterium]
MCGITGIITKEVLSNDDIDELKAATQQLAKRGPDASGVEIFEKIGLGHRRLSIIDTSESANQPFKDETERYTIVFNGEIFNYKQIQNELINKGVSFRTTGDTEVLLAAYIHFGTAFLNKLNGFFALAIYDSETKSTLLARDRFGIKPLIYYSSSTKIIFASEMKAIFAYNIPRTIDNSSLYTYFQLNYIPEPHSILQDVKKLEPGHYLKIDVDNKIQKIPFYQLNYPIEKEQYQKISYNDAQKEFLKLLDESVERRLVSDVPLGTFLSGGIDSSLITALAAKKVDRLSTFSIGFKDEPLFDETEYALAVAKKYNTDHHVFSLGNNDLLKSLYETLDYIDEPFADSSALAVNALSGNTSKFVKVALSGDGADELFAGYHKHMGEYMVRQTGVKQNLIKSLKPVWGIMPKSRNSKLGNLFRKLNKFSEGSSLTDKERYWLWASLMNEANAANLLIKKAKPEVYLKRKEQHLRLLTNSKDFNDILATDLEIVLRSDMLRKVDLMSMSHGLEVRTPFLDHHLVNFAFTLDASFKINKDMKKRIVQDASRELLPPELYNRPKQGFEVPLLNWFKTDLRDLIENDLLSTQFIKDQNIFNPIAVQDLWAKLNSPNPEDSQATIWALIVFNTWWKRYIA